MKADYSVTLHLVVDIMSEPLEYNPVIFLFVMSTTNFRLFVSIILYRLNNVNNYNKY